jgi:hypothetical protein
MTVWTGFSLCKIEMCLLLFVLTHLFMLFTIYFSMSNVKRIYR